MKSTKLQPSMVWPRTTQPILVEISLRIGAMVRSGQCDSRRSEDESSLAYEVYGNILYQVGWSVASVILTSSSKVSDLAAGQLKSDTLELTC